MSAQGHGRARPDQKHCDSYVPGIVDPTVTQKRTEGAGHDPDPKASIAGVVPAECCSGPTSTNVSRRLDGEATACAPSKPDAPPGSAAAVRTPAAGPC